MFAAFVSQGGCPCHECNWRAEGPNKRVGRSSREEYAVKVVLIIGGVLAVVVTIGAVVVFTVLPDGFLASLAPEPPRTEVRTEEALTRTLIETVSAPGEIEPLIKVDISAEVSARIEELPVREGAHVERDDVIVRLDDRNLQAAKESAKARRDGEKFRLQSEQARLAGLKTSLAFARKTFKRQQALFESGDVSLSTLDNAQERVDELKTSVESSTHAISVIESTLAAAEADIDRSDDALAKTVIRAPIEGIVTQLNAEVGEVVLLGTMNNPGTVIMTVADLSRMILNTQVAESDVAKIAEGQRAKIYINAYPDDVFNGIVRKIALQRATALDGTGFFETEIEIDLAGRRIYSGLVANVDIEIAVHEGTVVPSQAVVERLVEDLPAAIRNNPLVDRAKKTTNVVYRLVDGKALCTPVIPGPSDLTHRIIKEGLNLGDDVVVGPYKVLETIEHDDLITLETPPATGTEGEAPEAPATESEVGDAEAGIETSG